MLVHSILAAAALMATASVHVTASVDRIEEDRLVLDVAPYSSLPVPLALSPQSREGSALDLDMLSAPAGDATELRVLSAGSVRLRLEITGAPALGDRAEFDWPPALAPPVGAGSRLWVQVRENPAREAALRIEIQELRKKP